MPWRPLVRIGLSAALASLAGLCLGALLSGWMVVPGEASTWGEAAALFAYMPFVALIGALFVLPEVFPTAALVALFAGGLLWQLGRRFAWARRRGVWLAAGMLCGLVEAARLVALEPSSAAQSWPFLALPAAAAGAAAALIFRALMTVLPPYGDPDEEGGWDL